MDKLNTYRILVQNALEKYAGYKTLYSDNVETQTIFDTTHDHYQLVRAGWHKKDRVYGCIIHMDIKNEKIWIQYDVTEVGIANELVELGVPKSDIVLAFHAPYKRPYTDFAVN